MFEVFIVNYFLLSVSSTETIFAINDANKPNALINNPVISKESVFSKFIVKYKKIKKLIIWENIERASPVFILYKRSYYAVY